MTRAEDQVDWKDMFRRYVVIVGQAEGVSFLCHDQWTQMEWVALKQIVDAGCQH